MRTPGDAYDQAAIAYEDAASPFIRIEPGLDPVTSVLLVMDVTEQAAVQQIGRLQFGILGGRVRFGGWTPVARRPMR